MMVMMRNWLTIPVLMAILAATGLGICQATGRDPHAWQMIWAAGVVLAASAAAMVPLRLVRGRDQLVIARAGLIASAVQFLVTIVLTVALVLAKTGLEQVFLFWMLGFYFLALIALVVLVAQQVKSAPSATISKQEP